MLDKEVKPGTITCLAVYSQYFAYINTRKRIYAEVARSSSRHAIATVTMEGRWRPLYNHLKNVDTLRDFGLRAVRLSASFFLRHARFLLALRLAALLVAEFKADPELSHLTTRQNVRDPLNHEGAGLLVPRTRSCRGAKQAK